jgi:type II secretory pathway component PulF
LKRIFLLAHEQLILLIKIGETTGTLDRMLLQASLLFKKRIETTLLRGTTFIQPLLLVVLGFFISLVIIAIYLPLLSLTAHITTF